MNWRKGGRTPHGQRWIHPSGLVVVSSLDTTPRGPEWHVSVSKSGGRCTPEEAALACRDFGIAGAEEDNHTSGLARHFWMAVDPAKRTDCECKETEETIVEGDYAWQREREESTPDGEGFPETAT